MKYRSVVLSVLVLTVIVMVFGACSRLDQANTQLPIYNSPVITSVKDVVEHYYKDKASADRAYVGREVVFTGIEVEQVQSYFLTDQRFWDIQSEHLEIRSASDYYITADILKFIPRDPVYLSEIVPGSIVDIIGTCRGMEDGIVVLDNCWIIRIGGAVYELGPGY